MRKEWTADALERLYRLDWRCRWSTGLGECQAVAVAAVLAGGMNSGCNARPEDR